jgi:hypothetical protein
MKMICAMENIKQIDEMSLNRLFTKHFNDGFIIITADKASIDNAKVAKNRFKQLEHDVASAGYSYVPVWGGYKEINPQTGNKYDAASFEMGLLVPNQRVGNSDKPHETDKLPELGKKLASKYDQESFLYKPQGQEKKAYWIDRNGRVDYEFGNVTVNDLAQEFFTKLNNAKNNTKADRRFTFMNEIYLNKAPYSASEAYGRFGEQFYGI